MLLSGQEYVDVYASSLKDRVTQRAKVLGEGAAALASTAAHRLVPGSGEGRAANGLADPEVIGVPGEGVEPVAG